MNVYGWNNIWEHCLAISIRRENWKHFEIIVNLVIYFVFNAIGRRTVALVEREAAMEIKDQTVSKIVYARSFEKLCSTASQSKILNRSTFSVAVFDLFSGFSLHFLHIISFPVWSIGTRTCNAYVGNTVLNVSFPCRKKYYNTLARDNAEQPSDGVRHVDGNNGNSGSCRTWKAWVMNKFVLGRGARAVDVDSTHS